jgi:predicted nucleic acid-binding protein
LGEERGSGGSLDLVVLETSVLLNFLRVDWFELLIKLPGRRFLMTDHVRGEVTDGRQAMILREAIESGLLQEVRVDAPAEVAAFGKFVSLRVLGVGECAALALAVCRAVPIAIDDKAARKKARALFGFSQFLGTGDLVVAAIRSGLTDVAVADEMKRRWQDELRFRLPFASFADVL